MQSSDAIQIADWTLSFELRDAGFDQRLDEVDAALKAPVFIDPADSSDSASDQQQEQVFEQQYDPNNQAAVYQDQGQQQNNTQPEPPEYQEYVEEETSPVKKFLNKMTPIQKGAAAVLVLALFAGLFMQEEAPQEQAKVVVEKPIDKLSPEERDMVIQAYGNAKSLYASARYQNAKDEIDKVHQKVEYYEDSRDIERAVVEALATIAEQERIEREDRERLEQEERIQRLTAECRAKINPQTVEWIQVEDCLSSIMSINPDHAKILALKSDVQRMITDRNLKKAQQEEYRNQVQQIQALFDKAMQRYKKGHLRESLPAFNTVVSAALPDPKKLKEKSKKHMAAIKRKLRSDQAIYERQADEAYKDGKLKEAVLLLQKARRIDPGNQTINGRIVSIISELRKQMQIYYHESIVEESIGELDIAKNKWKKIMDTSVPDEEYFNKSKIKLKKHGFIE